MSLRLRFLEPLVHAAVPADEDVDEFQHHRFVEAVADRLHIVIEQRHFYWSLRMRGPRRGGPPINA